MKHTPAPWMAEGFCVKYGDKFDDVIAECSDLHGRALENACLIAAAPDLLEACKAVSKCKRTEHLPAKVVIGFMEAIAKAEGGKT